MNLFNLEFKMKELNVRDTNTHKLHGIEEITTNLLKIKTLLNDLEILNVIENSDGIVLWELVPKLSTNMFQNNMSEDRIIIVKVVTTFLDIICHQLKNIDNEDKRNIYKLFKKTWNCIKIFERKKLLKYDFFESIASQFATQMMNFSFDTERYHGNKIYIQHVVNNIIVELGKHQMLYKCIVNDIKRKLDVVLDTIEFEKSLNSKELECLHHLITILNEISFLKEGNTVLDTDTIVKLKKIRASSNNTAAYLISCIFP